MSGVAWNGLTAFFAAAGMDSLRIAPAAYASRADGLSRALKPRRTSTIPNPVAPLAMASRISDAFVRSFISIFLATKMGGAAGRGQRQQDVHRKLASTHPVRHTSSPARQW